MAEKRKFEERKQKHTKLKQLWEERGMVKFEQKFDTISDTVATKIKNKIKKLENDYKIAYEGSIPRVSNGTYHMKNVLHTPSVRSLEQRVFSHISDPLHVPIFRIPLNLFRLLECI